MPFRALIKTHHMTSRKKIQAITKSAKHHSCSVLIKTGKPPGVMIAQGSEDAVKQWVETVKVCSSPGRLVFGMSKSRNRIDLETGTDRMQ